MVVVTVLMVSSLEVKFHNAPGGAVTMTVLMGLIW